MEKAKIETLYLNFNIKQSKLNTKFSKYYQTSSLEICEIRNIHKIREVKNTSLSQTWVDWIEMPEQIATAYQHPLNIPLEKVNFKRPMISHTKQNAKWDPTGCPKNLPCRNLESKGQTILLLRKNKA